MSQVDNQRDWEISLVNGISKQDSHLVAKCLTHITQLHSLPKDIPHELLAHAEEKVLEMLDPWFTPDFVTFVAFALTHVIIYDRQSLEILTMVVNKFTGPLEQLAVQLICVYFSRWEELFNAVSHLLVKMDNKARYQVPMMCEHMKGSLHFLLYIGFTRRHSLNRQSLIRMMKLLVDNGHQLGQEGDAGCAFTLLSVCIHDCRQDEVADFIVSQTSSHLLNIKWNPCSSSTDCCNCCYGHYDTRYDVFYMSIVKRLFKLPMIIAEKNPTIQSLRWYFLYEFSSDLIKYAHSRFKSSALANVRLLITYIGMNACFWSCQDFITLHSCDNSEALSRVDQLLLFIDQAGHQMAWVPRGRKSSLSLVSLSRIAVRKSLPTFQPKNIVLSAIRQLPMPAILQEFIAMREVEEYVNNYCELDRKTEKYLVDHCV